MGYKRSALMEERLSENRERIVKAARKLVARGGFREAQVSAVAAAAGLSTGAIYRYFPSKAELFTEVLTSAVKHEIQILEVIARSDDPATARLAAAVESFARRALAGPNLAYAFIAEPVDDGEVDAARIRCRRDFGGVIKYIVQDGIAKREFPKQDASVSAACIVGAFTEALVGPIAPSGRAVENREQLVKAIAAFCVNAVTKPGIPPQKPSTRSSATVSRAR